MPRKTTTTKRQRAAALTASEPKLNGANAPLAISHAGHGIAALAQELADLNRLYNTMDAGETATDVALNKDTERGINSDRRVIDANMRFKDMRRHTFAKLEALEQLILELEPTTASETLTLALLLVGPLDQFVSDHTDTDKSDAQADSEKLERVLRAIIRGLINGCGATSPLTDTYARAQTLRPWAEARADAAREAVPYQVEYDPARGSLKRVREAAR
jgi:hypothetical protein